MSDPISLILYVLFAMLVPAVVYLPDWYRNRLIRRFVDEAIAGTRLGDDSRDELAGMLKARKYLDIIDWMRKNEGKFPGELLAIIKRTSLFSKRIMTAAITCFAFCIVLGLIVTLYDRL